MVTSENITEQWAVAKPAVHSRGGLVATNHYEASEIGAEVLRAGGNAVDAAVATGFAMAVTYPPAGNLCCGRFMMNHVANGHEGLATASP